MYELDICYMYPDLLNLYGDRGNIFSLIRRTEWRGIKVNIHNVSIGDSFIPELYDIVFLGGGQDYEQEIIQKDIMTGKANEIKNAIENNKVFLCICGGYQILGKYYKTWDGKEIEFLGLLDIWTIGGQKRMVGNVVYECDILKTDNFDGMVVGFENHSGRTYLGENVKPLGKIVVGYGNNGEDSYEGAIHKNTICSYSHGCLLPKNPVFSDYLISKALKNKYKDFSSLEPLNDKIEIDAHNFMIKKSVG